MRWVRQFYADFVVLSPAGTCHFRKPFFKAQAAVYILVINMICLRLQRLSVKIRQIGYIFFEVQRKSLIHFTVSQAELIRKLSVAALTLKV